MDCDKCGEIGYSGGHRVCGMLLSDGETYYVRNGRIIDPCPKEIWERYNHLVSIGKIKPDGGNK
jgi:hypothetical protein